tara:strand:- start:2675 stop:2881 length:207 start_codon:yes stop_codon:yes gene_type:complete
MKKSINTVLTNQYQNRVNTAKQIAKYLGLDYSIMNRTVLINYQSNNIVNIILNNDWDNKINFNLNNLK